MICHTSSFVHCSKQTNLSTLSITGCLYTDRCCLSFICLRPSHNFLFLNNQTCCLDTFVTKARLYRFFLHQTQSKRNGKSVADIIYPKSSFGPAGASVDSGGGPHGWPSGWRLASSYTRTSTDSDSTLLSMGPNRRQNPAPACTAAGINLLVS